MFALLEDLFGSREGLHPSFFFFVSCKYVSWDVSTADIKLNYGFGKQTAQQLPIFKILGCWCLGMFSGEINYRCMVTTFKDASPEQRQEMLIGWLQALMTKKCNPCGTCSGWQTCMFWNQLCHASASVSAKTKQSQTRMPNTTSKNNVSRKNATGPRGGAGERSCAGRSRAPSSCV